MPRRRKKRSDAAGSTSDGAWPRAATNAATGPATSSRTQQRSANPPAPPAASSSAAPAVAGASAADSHALVTSPRLPSDHVASSVAGGGAASGAGAGAGAGSGSGTGTLATAGSCDGSAAAAAAAPVVPLDAHRRVAAFRLSWLLLDVVGDALRRVFKHCWDTTHGHAHGRWSDSPASGAVFCAGEANCSRLLPRQTRCDVSSCTVGHGSRQPA